MALSQRVKRNVQRYGVVIVGFIVLVMTCSAVVFAAPSQATTAPPHIPYPACFGKGAVGVELNTHIAYECLGVGGTDQGVGVYWSDNLYQLAYYWHPDHGGMVVTEEFWKSCHEVSLERHGAPCGLYSGVPMTAGAQGVDPWANGRTIELADGCVVEAPTDLGAPPTWCSVVLDDGGLGPLPGHQMTTVEADSIADYWSIMRRYTPDIYW